jgi:hypothetical protein
MPLMLPADFWEMWWNPFARDASASDNSNMTETTKQRILGDNRHLTEYMHPLWTSGGEY